MFALCSVLSKVLRNKLAMMIYDVAIALILCFPIIITSFVLYLMQNFVDYNVYFQLLLFLFVNSMFFSCCV